MSDKYEYIEYEKLSDAVRDFESGKAVFLERVDGSWLPITNHSFWYIGDTYAKRVLKPEPRYETLYECIDSTGNLGLYNLRGAYPNFKYNQFENNTNDTKILSRKTGRTFKLNLDTWEIEL